MGIDISLDSFPQVVYNEGEGRAYGAKVLR
jgi:hypothetical protein